MHRRAPVSGTDIAGGRLVLRLMGKEVVAAALAGDLAGAGRMLGAEIPAELLERTGVLTYGKARMDEDPLYAPWGPRAILLAGAMIGHVRFHSRPDPVELRPYARGAVEFGYTVFAPWRRRGYAAEAVEAVIGWAQAQHGVRRFVVTIAPANAASLALAERLGFARVGEQMDEIDGLEFVLLREAPGGAAIRAAETADIAEVRALLVETWHDTYDAILGADVVTEMTDRWHAMEVLAAQAAREDAVFLVAMLDGIVAGHAFAQPRDKGEVRLSRLYVRPRFQRQGVGGALLKTVTARFPATARMTLEVEARNAKGLAFYSRHGFSVVGEIAEEGSRPLLMARG